uniref:C3H1-type domain-containing protein n=1 Tax=Oncorhynchus tshawytscha TaxID=74940 RepID=A0A8C8F6Q4_ONCTS
MDMERQKRREEIQKAMGFIQSSLPFPEPENYAAFLTQLVCNLLDEGNTVFRDGEWRQAAQHYSEGVNVARYAQAEALVIPPELLESLYVNRAAAHSQFGEFERGVQDCDSALCVCEGSRRALYRKALCLRELGRLREAYECGTGCLLTAPHVSQGHMSQSPVQGAIPTNLPNTAVGLHPPYSSSLPAPSPQLPPAFFSSSVSQMPSLEPYPSLGQRDQTSTQALDALGAFSPGTGDMEGKGGVGIGGLDSLSEYTLPGEWMRHEQGVWVRVCVWGCQFHQNSKAIMAFWPLSSFLQPYSSGAAVGCPPILLSAGPRVIDYQYQPEAAHRCKRDVLLCRFKNTDDPTWKRVRPRPARNNFLGAFVLCKEVQERQECQYGENCTFAYCQEEIDVWTQERKGALSRELLFDPLGSTERRALSVTRLLQLHMGMFMFLCEECFDSKPRIISKRSKENLAVCSNLTARHPFDDNKCLVHVVRSANVRYSKVRPLHPLCQFDVCRHEVRYGCQREDSCSFAHSVIELKCWVLQQDTGITHEEMVQESKRHWYRLEQNAQRQKVSVRWAPCPNTIHNFSYFKGLIYKMSLSLSAYACPTPELWWGRGRGLNLKMKFVCGQCWRDGQVNEPDKALKYCTAKARHSWTKERRVLLVKSFEKKKWVVVRPLPFSRTYPQQYDMCVHVMKQKKCHYIGNCSFAHSLEERDVWTYMKDNSLRDMQQMYDMWLTMTNQNRRTDRSLMTPPPEEKQVSMTTDYTESLVRGFQVMSFIKDEWLFVLFDMERPFDLSLCQSGQRLSEGGDM